ncbi:dynamin-binding protein-like [Phymastichus coffea]|uniref:dynamin-binding protein-like n=1 Tax=Phymastichus coffea TaxID=108790 RepID=UPI00273BAB62|nr:dynamin-binding protein-like [Phymastichus coffea]
MEPGTLAKVLNDFLTTEDGELSLVKGQYFLVEKVIDKHWCYGESNHKVGKFPIKCLHKVEIPRINDNEALFISIAPFRGEQPGDITFGLGELIIGNPEASSGWLSGHTDVREGIFPASYVWQVDTNQLKIPNKKNIIKRTAKVKANLKAQLDEELDLTEGEIVIVTEILDDGWCRGYNEHGNQGTFPEGFITYLEESTFDEVDDDHSDFSIINNFEKSTMSEMNQNQAHKSYTNSIQARYNELPSNNSSRDNTFPQSAIGGRIYKDFGDSYPSNIHLHYDDPAPDYNELFPENAVPKIDFTTENNASALKPYAISLFPFKAQFPNELSFETGQVVELVRYIDNEWAEGIINNAKGIFPVSYVNVIVDCVESQSVKAQDDEQRMDELQINDHVKVEYQFDAQMDGDLSVSEGEIVTVVEMTNKDWVTVKNNHGKTGFCPRSYLTKISKMNDQHDDVFHDALDNFVMTRNTEKDENDGSAERSKRLSEPHRPAPPAPTPGRVPLQKQNNVACDPSEEPDAGTLIRQKRADQRQNVITELYLTEKDYVRDLKMTYETFNLHNPDFLESKGIDVVTLFGNISEVTAVAEELLELIQRAMKGCDEDYQTIGPCFLKMSEKMRNAYGRYCSNHESSLALLQKYESNREIMKIFEKGVETLRMQVACFDMNSVLIKPVQRILKYPLILNELLKATEDDHPDKPKIGEAAIVMADVASYINEYKRKKEIAEKYLSCNNTLIGRMANLNMHSVAKKSSRLSAKLSVTLGLSNLPSDPKFDELAKDFTSLEKCTKQLMKDVMQCMDYLDNETLCGTVLTEQMHMYFTGVPCNEVERLRQLRNVIRFQFLNNFKECVCRRVVDPLNYLITLLAGPELLINKRYDKMLDYDTAISRDGRGPVSDDLHTAKSHFEALNQQLIEELPVFIEAGTSILYNCIGAFTNARKLYNGKIMKRYLNVSESVNQVSLDAILESFLVHHNLLYNQISRFSYGGSNSRTEENKDNYYLQSTVHIKNLKSKFPPNNLYVVTSSVTGSSPHDLPVTKGTIVGVIKTQDPMGNTSKWFVDNGTSKGFVESQYLELSDEAKLIEASASASGACSEDTTDLMALDSPVKAAKRYSADLQSLCSNTSDEYEPAPNYENIMKMSNELKAENTIHPELKPEKVYNEKPEEYVYALYDFQAVDLAGTLPIKEGQALKVLQKHDEKMNSNWWLVENRFGGKGYVPYNYVGSERA